jgi:Flp pilus assembly protein TadD
MTVQVGKSLPWLVKSGGRIMGPFSTKEVIEKLQGRELVVLDEISQPFSRWVYIRDERTFLKTVEELRMKSSRMSDDTTTDIDQTRSSTLTPGMTASITRDIDDLTEDLSKKAVQDVLFKSVDDKELSDRSRSGRGSAEYIFEKDPRIQSRANEAARWLWVFSFSMIFITVVYVLFAQFIAKPMQNEAKADEKIRMGNEALEDGQYANALKFFQEAYELKPKDKSIWLHLGLLKVQLMNQNVEARRLLEKLAEIKTSDLKRIHTALGLSYFRGGELNDAETYFTKALDLDARFLPALVNLGAVALYQNNYSQAQSQFQLAIKEGSADGAEVSMLVEALIQSYQKSKDLSFLEEAKKYIDDYLNARGGFLGEVHVLKIWVLAQMRKASEIYQTIDSFLDLDPLQSSMHKYDIYVLRDRLSWKLLNQWCLRSTERLEPNSHVLAIEAMCLFRAGEMLDASKKIENAVAQAPKDPQVQAIYAYLLDEMGNFEKSKVSIDRALQYDADKKLKLPRVLQAKFCMKVEDQICALNYLNELLKIDPKSLFALAGLAKINLTKANISEARKYVQRGLDLSPNYVPLLELRRQMSRTQDRAKGP